MKISIDSRARRFALFFGLAGCLIGAAAAQPADQTSSPSAAPAASATGDMIGKSVVKIISTARYPDRFEPWMKKAPVTATASGVVIEGRRILTLAHAVAYASELQIQANGATDKVTARVEAVSPEIDLAVLKLDDESFFDTHPPLPRVSKLPQLKDAIFAYGFPAADASMGVTLAAVTHVDFTSYNLGVRGLRLQVDAGVSLAASGGPAVAGGKMIGLSFALAAKSDNSSYIIPCEEIELFLNAIHAGSYHGRPNLDIVLQQLQNPALRSFLGVDKSVHGVVVQQLGLDPAGSPLQKWDVITQVGNTDIDDQGVVHLENGLQVAFTYLLSQSAANGKAPVTVIRSGKPLHLDVPISANPPRLLPALNGDYPDYFVCGPLAFSDASQELFLDVVNSTISGNTGLSSTLRLLGQDSPLVTRCDDSPKFEGERLVVVTSFFPHKLGEAYPNPVAQVVKSVNGVPIKNLAHLVQLVRDSKDKFITVDFFGHYTSSLVFPREEMLADTESILSDNNVHSQGSPDMMAIWNAKR